MSLRANRTSVCFSAARSNWSLRLSRGAREPIKGNKAVVMVTYIYNILYVTGKALNIPKCWEWLRAVLTEKLRVIGEQHHYLQCVWVACEFRWLTDDWCLMFLTHTVTDLMGGGWRGWTHVGFVVAGLEDELLGMMLPVLNRGGRGGLVRWTQRDWLAPLACLEQQPIAR